MNMLQSMTTGPSAVKVNQNPRCVVDYAHILSAFQALALKKNLPPSAQMAPITDMQPTEDGGLLTFLPQIPDMNLTDLVTCINESCQQTHVAETFYGTSPNGYPVIQIRLTPRQRIADAFAKTATHIDHIAGQKAPTTTMRSRPRFHVGQQTLLIAMFIFTIVGIIWASSSSSTTTAPFDTIYAGMTSLEDRFTKAILYVSSFVRPSVSTKHTTGYTF